MGNFLFRTANYRQARSQRKATEQTNELLGKLVANGTTIAPGTYLASDGRYYSADGRYVWDGSTWRAR